MAEYVRLTLSTGGRVAVRAEDIRRVWTRERPRPAYQANEVFGYALLAVCPMAQGTVVYEMDGRVADYEAFLDQLAALAEPAPSSQINADQLVTSSSPCGQVDVTEGGLINPAEAVVARPQDEPKSSSRHGKGGGA